MQLIDTRPLSCCPRPGPPPPPINLAKLRFFEDRAPRWDTDHRSPSEDARITLIRPHFGLREGDLVLDIGCGTGKIVPFLLEAVGESGRVLEVDFSLKMLAAGRAKQVGTNVHFLQADAQAPALRDRALDGIVCFALFPHIDDKHAALRGFARNLKPGRPLVIGHTMGRAELNAFFRKVGDPLDKDNLPENEDMLSLLSEAGFEGGEIVEGPHHYIARAWTP
jgi:ubiquinone/menaquinone biosynthesis C-methylase UbiE